MANNRTTNDTTFNLAIGGEELAVIVVALDEYSVAARSRDSAKADLAAQLAGIWRSHVPAEG